MEILNILKQYKFDSPIDTVERINSGNINTTYKLISSDGEKYILQKINNVVFQDVELVMNNIVLVTDNLNKAKELKSLDKMQVIKIKSTVDKKTFAKFNGSYYRVYEFMKDAETYNCATDWHIIRSAGEAFGLFSKLLNGGESIVLQETIPNFHNTELRIENLIRAYKKPNCERRGKAQKTYNYLIKFKKKAKVFKKMLEKTPRRVVHNDTKISNVAFSIKTKEAIGVLDLDTVMIGSFAYDFGDGGRSVAGPNREDEKNLNKVFFDLEKFTQFSDGYLSHLAKVLNKQELKTLFYGLFFVSIELSSRFLTDYLEEDKYFKISYKEQNLDRAICQAHLAKDILKKKKQIKRIIKKIYKKYV